MDREPDIAYWQPRVMRHHSDCGEDEFAIHEVYFDRQDRAVYWTQDAISPRFVSPDALKVWIEEQLEKPDEGVFCGDLGYQYNHDSFHMWLQHIDEPPLDYPAT